MNGERRKMTLHKLRLRIQKKIPRTIYGRVIFSVVSKTIIIFQFARLVIVYVLCIVLTSPVVIFL